MRKVAMKYMRDNMQQKIQNQMKNFHPNFEFEHQFMKLPNYPKIILYSNVPGVDQFISQYPSKTIIQDIPRFQDGQP